MHTVKKINGEPIPGYRLLEPLGSGGFGEVWKCEAPGGLFKALKFVSGPSHPLDDSGNRAERELRALERIKAIRHPYLLSIERAEVIDGDLLIVMELADRSLHDLLQEYRGKGQPGIPRAELLRYLGEAAEALDVMNQEHGLQHLDVKPRNLFLFGQHVKVGDFGQVNSLHELQGPGDRNEAVTPLYAAPETFLGRITLCCDQYSLAITYHELLTGSLPFSGTSFRQVALQHVQAKPDLGALPESDRAAVARALSKEPGERFPSCRAFLRALEAAPPATPPVRTRNTKPDLCLGELSNTAVLSAGDTPAAAPRPRPAGSVPGPVGIVPAHQLVERIAVLPLGEVWKALNAEGARRLVKLVSAPERLDDDPDSDPLTILQSIRHERLAPLEVVRCGTDRVALITDPGDGSLADRLRQSQREGLPGIPRMELLEYLQQAAEALDELQRTYRIQHLALNPRQFVLHEGRLRILDFGLAELLWQPAGFEPAGVNTRYAAPELFAHQSSRACDQYSLALVYQELLTGVHPFRNLNQRQMAAARVRSTPDVGLLPAIDRPVLLRALHTNPDERFPGCTEFVAALQAVSHDLVGGPRTSAQATRTSVQTVSVPVVQPAAPAAPRPALPSPQTHAQRQVVAEEVAAAAGNREVRGTASLRYTLHRGQDRGAVAYLEARCFGRLLPGTVRLKLGGFQQQWQADLVEKRTDTLEEGVTAHVAYSVPLPASRWQRWLGRQPVLEVRICLKVPATTTESLTEVAVEVHPRRCTPEQGAEILGTAGPVLLESLRNYLQLHTERRREERFPYRCPVQVSPILPTGEAGPPVVAQGKDISTLGLGLFLPCRPTSSHVLLQFAPGGRPPVSVPARVVRVQPLADGRFEVGLCFAWDEF